MQSAKNIKGALSTASNLCSNAKDLKAVQSGGAIQLQSAGGTYAYVLDKGKKLAATGSKVYVSPSSAYCPPFPVAEIQAQNLQAPAMKLQLCLDCPA